MSPIFLFFSVFIYIDNNANKYIKEYEKKS